MEERTGSAYSEEQLIHLVKQLLPETAEQEVSLKLIRQGVANRVYQLQIGDKKWAVKCLGPAKFSAVNYPQIKSIQDQLAQQGLAPKVAAFDATKRIWVENWIETPLSHKPDIARLGHALSRIHNAEVKSPTLALLSCWQHYIEQLPTRQQRGFARERDQLQPVITQRSEYQDFCFCHNDLSYSHLVGAELNLMIDWEYAAVGNRYFDLAACALINQLSSQQGLTLCASYAEYANLPEDEVQHKFNTFLPVVEFTNRLWSAAAPQQNV